MYKISVTIVGTNTITGIENAYNEKELKTKEKFFNCLAGVKKYDVFENSSKTHYQNKFIKTVLVNN